MPLRSIFTPQIFVDFLAPCAHFMPNLTEDGMVYTPEQIEQRVRADLNKELTEIHIVGGLWRECNLDYYKETFSRIKSIDPTLHIKALTPVEYDF